jgi:hypothetical protein
VKLAHTALVGLALASAAVVTPPRGLAAQDPSVAVAFGIVSDQFGQPVVDAEVTVAGADRTLTTRTVAAGSYRLDSIPPGTHRLRIREAGYLPLTASLDVTAGDPRDRDFTLVKLPFALEPGLVQTPEGEFRASFSEFTARQARGVGVFLDRAAIDRLQPTTTTDLMRAVKSFRVLSAGKGKGAYRLVSSGTGGDGACSARLLVDGFPYTPVDGIDDFDPEHVGAIEAYAPGEAPAPLDALSGPCGTVVVWLRR